MNKELIEDQAALYALGTLPAEEVDAFEALLRRDHELREAVHQMQRLNELDAQAAAPVEPPFHVYSRLMAELETAASAPSKQSAPGRVLPFVAWSGWAAAACIALGLGFGVFNATDPRQSSSDIVLNNLANPRLVAVTPPSDEFGLEDRMLELAGLAEAYWFSREGIPTGQRLSEADAEVEELSGGFTIFDRKYNIGFIAVENMPEETEGKTYHVWAKAGSGARPVRAGALPIGDESRGLFFFDLSSLPESVDVSAVDFFVTEEEVQDPQEPSEMVVLSGL